MELTLSLQTPEPGEPHKSVTPIYFDSSQLYTRLRTLLKSIEIYKVSVSHVSSLQYNNC